MKTLNEHNTRPTTQTIGITYTYVIDSKGKKPAYNSKTSIGNGGNEVDDVFVLFILLFSRNKISEKINLN